MNAVQDALWVVFMLATSLLGTGMAVNWLFDRLIDWLQRKGDIAPDVWECKRCGIRVSAGYPMRITVHGHVCDPVASRSDFTIGTRT